jgi:hypothetical protein
MTAPTPEQRAEWRDLASDLDCYAETGGDLQASEAIVALLDALDAADAKVAYFASAVDLLGTRAERAEAALAEKCPGLHLLPAPPDSTGW